MASGGLPPTKQPLPHRGWTPGANLNPAQKPDDEVATKRWQVSKFHSSVNLFWPNKSCCFDTTRFGTIYESQEKNDNLTFFSKFFCSLWRLAKVKVSARDVAQLYNFGIFW